MLGGWLWRFAVVGGIAVAVATRWSPKNLTEGLITAVAAALLYCLTMLPSALRPPLGNYIRPLLETFRDKYISLCSTVASGRVSP
jgi:hypothetical protein